MTASNYPNCLATTLTFEGGKSMVATDPGNWTGGKVGKGKLKGTNMGIAASAHPTLDIMHLTRDQVAEIYQNQYWKPSGADAEATGLDLMLFDASVNSGPAQGRAWLKTAKGKAADTVSQIRAYADARLSFMHRLRTFRTFGAGWTRRVATCEAKAIRMASGPQAAPVALKLASVDQVARRDTASKSAGASIVTGVPASAAVSNHTLFYVVIGLFAVAMLVGGFIAWQHHVRADALAKEARA